MMGLIRRVNYVKEHYCRKPQDLSLDTGSIWQCECGKIYLLDRPRGHELYWDQISQRKLDKILKKDQG